MLKLKSLYDIDFNLWVEEQVSALKSGHIKELDLPNLIEEIEDWARRDKQALRSHLKILLLHLLRWQYQSGKRSKSWQVSIFNARNEIEDLLAGSPSLKNYLPTIVTKTYGRARALAVYETGLELSSFPTDCPYTLEQALAVEFMPE